MKISIFGTRSGTEPTDGRKQTAFSLTVGEKIYWFDAGECCSETASEMGIDLLKIASVFISHPHIDHTGGLVKLLWVINKLSEMKGVIKGAVKIRVFCPCSSLWDGVRSFFIADREKMPELFIKKQINDGLIYDDGIVRVFALHSTHMPPRNDRDVSFSFLIEAEGKRIVYSGDVGDLSDMNDFLKIGCDILIMETGHHDAEEICTRTEENGLCKQIIFVHHHRKTVNNFTEYTSSVKSHHKNIIFANDRDEYEI